MKHALVVGGTGMLANVSLWLLENGYHVSVIARNAGRMDKLIEKTSFKRNLTPLLVDYKNSDELQKRVQSAIKQNGQINLVVAWIHSIAENALSTIVTEVSNNNHQWELFHVLGSSSNVDQIKKVFPVPENCLNYQIRLGFVMEETYSRWLTHQEISEGVIEAIKKKEKVRILGQLEPWKKRP